MLGIVYGGCIDFYLGFFGCLGKFVVYDLLGLLEVSMWVGFGVYLWFFFWSLCVGVLGGFEKGDIFFF